MNLKRVTIEIDSVCNLSCPMCFLGGFRREKIFLPENTDKFLSPDLFKKLIDEIATDYSFAQSSEPFFVMFSGGEPLLHPQIFEFLSYAKEKGVGVTVFTNGTLIDSVRAAKLVEMMPAALMFSLDGPQEIHDSIRGQGNFEKTCKAIDSIQLIKQVILRNNPKIFINTLMNNLNVNCLDEMISIAKSLNVYEISFSHIQWSDQYLVSLAGKEFKERLDYSSSLNRMVEAMGHDLKVEEKKTEKLINQINFIKKEHKNGQFPRFKFFPDLSPHEIDLWYSRKYGKINSCSSVNEWIRVDVNGDVQPVCAVIPFSFGNLKNQSLREILNGEKVQKFFGEINDNGYFYACQRCCRRSSKSTTLL